MTLADRKVIHEEAPAKINNRLAAREEKARAQAEAASKVKQARVAVDVAWDDEAQALIAYQDAAKARREKVRELNALLVAAGLPVREKWVAGVADGEIIPAEVE